MRSLVRIVMVLLVGIAIAGCTTFQVSGMQVVEEMPGMTPIGDFEVSFRVSEFLGLSGGPNLFNVSATNMDNEIRDAIRREIENRSGDAAINVQVKYEATFLDLLFGQVTFNIWAPATATITGTVISFNE